MTASARAISPDDSEWLLHMQAWVIQDGNYPDLELGMRLRHAVVFEHGYGPALSRPAPELPGVGLVRAGTEYWASGRTIFAVKGRWTVCVVDFGGLIAYSDRLFGWSRVGTRVTGLMRFRIDEYSYRESYSRIRRMPSIESDWQVTGLWRPSEPTEVATHFASDKEQFVTVERTQALSDLGGFAEYVVQVRRIG